MPEPVQQVRVPDDTTTEPVGSRPGVHFTAERGWVNDPLAPTWDGRRYHLFFQYVPGLDRLGSRLSLGPRGVGRPAALEGACGGPRPGHAGRRRVVGVDGPARRRLPDLLHVGDQRRPPDGAHPVGRLPDLDGPWGKGDVVAVPPTGLGVTAFRDPFVFREDDGWRMLVGASLGGTEAAAAGYSSSDLSHWVFDGIAASRTRSSRDPVWTGSLWECPQLVRVDDRRVLVVSVWDADRLHHVAAATVGSAGPTLVPDRWHQLTVGTGYYAPAAFTDADGASCLVFWMRGLLDLEAGRAGALSVPHRIERRDDRIVLRLHPAVTSAVRSCAGDSNTALAEPADVSVHPLRVRTGGRVALSVTQVGRRVVIDADGTRGSIEAPATDIQVLIDGPCVEVVTLGGAFAHTLPGPTRRDDRANGARLAGSPDRTPARMREKPLARHTVSLCLDATRP